MPREQDYPAGQTHRKASERRTRFGGDVTDCQEEAVRLGQLSLEAAREEMGAQRGTQDCPLHVLPIPESSPVQTGPYPFSF